VSVGHGAIIGRLAEFAYSAADPYFRDMLERKQKVLALAVAFAALGVAGLAAQVLQDQFGTEADLGALASRGRTIVLWSDRRDAAELLDAWGLALTAKVPAPSAAAVAVLTVTDLSALPFFVPRGAVTSQLKRNYPKQSIFLDWKGEAKRRWSLEGAGVAVIVLGPEGTVRAKATGTASAAEASRLVEAAFRP